MSVVDLSGVMIPAATPFDPVTGDVDVIRMRANVRHWAEHPIRGIVVGGSTGEAVLLDPDERRLLLEATRGALPDDRILVAGTGAESLRATLALTSAAADAGADAVLVQPPAFFRGAMTPEVIADHFRRVADASTVPVIVYQVPLKMSTLDLPNGLICELSKHENIVGVKDSRGVLEHVAEIVEGSTDDFQVIVGNGALLYAALEVGAAGGILGVANMMPGESSEIVTAFREGRHADAGRLQERVGPLHNAIVGGMGVPGVKACLDLMGMEGGPLRPPLRAATDAQRDAAREALSTADVPMAVASS